jgi:hypothetical protein
VRVKGATVNNREVNFSTATAIGGAKVAIPTTELITQSPKHVETADGHDIGEHGGNGKGGELGEEGEPLRWLKEALGLMICAILNINGGFAPAHTMGNIEA